MVARRHFHGFAERCLMKEGLVIAWRDTGIPITLTLQMKDCFEPVYCVTSGPCMQRSYDGLS